VSAVVNLRRHYSLALTERVIPAAALVPLQDAQALVDQANEAVARLDAQLQGERERARESGRAQGRDAALAEFAASLSALRDARDRLGEQMRAQLGELAVGVVERIAPALGAERLVSTLVAEAVRQLAFEPSLIVRVHPAIADAIRGHLAQEGLGTGAAPIEIVATPELGEFDCVIETEGGVVRAGLREQLDQVRVILAVAQQESVRAEATHTDREDGDGLA
jgi:type III secretion protein L